MKSPCLDRGDGSPCKLLGADKNNEECLNCKARLVYVDNIDRCPSSSMPMEITKRPRAKKMNDKKICEKCKERPVMGKHSKYCSPCLNSFKNEKKPKNTTPDKQKPEKARKTANGAVISVDFGEYGSLLNKIEKVAFEEIRPLNMQIVYMLKKQLESLEGNNAI